MKRWLFLVCLVACGTTQDTAPEPSSSSSSPSPSPAPAPTNNETPDPTPTPTPKPTENKAAKCATTFGTILTAPYGRLDGTVLAVVKPTDEQCPRPNSDHLILQVRANGQAYRMVVNIASDRGADRRVRFGEISTALPGAPFAEGWHGGETLDYVTSLSVHSTDPEFAPLEMTPLADAIADAITIGQKVSVYASTSGGDSAHKVHRNTTGQDGAIVLDPTGAARWLLFHFEEQSF